METSFKSAFFAGNREKLRNLFKGTAPIIITANGLLQSNGDQTFPFRQDSSFWYLVGIDEPDAVLVIDKSKEYLILSEDYEHKAKFEGAQSVNAITEISGINEVLSHKEGWAKLSPRVKKVKHLATIAASPAYVEYYGFYSNPARARLIDKLNGINDKAELLDLKKHLSTLRMTKQPEEIEAIKHAISITSKTLKTVSAKRWASTTTENRIDNEIRYLFSKNGAEALAFENVVAIGASTATIHHESGTTMLKNEKILLLDVGAQYGHYASDISRVYSIGNPTKRIKDVYSQVSDALEKAISKLKPGVLLPDFELEMEHVVGEKLRELGLIKTIDRENVRKYFPTYTAHHLGLDTHDVYEKDIPLKPNMILAVEPGIYIPEEGIGIRIEEDVIITESGCAVLTSSLPRVLTSLTMKEV